MPNLVQAAAEGMPNINRRSFLGKAAVAVPAMGMAAIVPAEAKSLSTYDRAARVHELAGQTADAFDAWNEYMGGSWELRIRAADEPFPILFANLEALRETPQEKMARAAREYMDAAKEIDPTATEWHRSIWADDDMDVRFSLIGARKAVRR